jgi:hypothetical protein
MTPEELGKIKGDQKFFVDTMKGALPDCTIVLDNGQLRSDDLLAYFRTLKDAPFDSWKQYERYAQAFYIHVDEALGRTSAINWRPRDTCTPSGVKTCDTWAQIAARARSQDGSSRRIVDCRGFSFLAHHLLQAADWSPVGYRAFYVPGRTDIFWHVAIELLWAKTEGMNNLTIGTAQASNGGVTEEQRRAYQRSFPDDYTRAVCTEEKPTQLAAFEAVPGGTQFTRPACATRLGATSIPNRAPAGSIPPRSSAGRRLT